MGCKLYLVKLLLDYSVCVCVYVTIVTKVIIVMLKGGFGTGRPGSHTSCVTLASHLLSLSPISAIKWGKFVPNSLGLKTVRQDNVCVPGTKQVHANFSSSSQEVLPTQSPIFFPEQSSGHLYQKHLGPYNKPLN